MKRFTIFLSTSFILLLISSSCLCKKEVERVQNLRDIKTLNPNKAYSEKPINFDFKIDSTWIEDLILFAKVSYKGEKSDIDFNLEFNGMWLKVYPARANAVLVPSISKLSGKKMVHQLLKFNLSPIKGDKSVFDIRISGIDKSVRVGKFEIND